MRVLFWIRKLIKMGWIEAALGAGVAAAQTVTSGGPKRQYKWNKRAAEDANAMNRANQEWIVGQEKQMQAEARAYDSPKEQMKRYLEAGLNPHLIYGNGSSAGGAFPISAPGVPGVRLDAPSAQYPDVAGSFLAAGQRIAQTQLTEARTDESVVSAALKQIQADIARTNPMLDPSVASWVSTSMMETARLKSIESRQWLGARTVGDQRLMNVQHRINSEVDALVQKLGLNSAELAVKNKILQSKEFENAVKEVQASWLKDADVSPEHIRQGLMLLLSKMLGR